MAIRKRLIVSGRVQGVFYRDTCRRIAAREGVAGWASNLPDGRVEVVLEGEPASVDRVVDWCRGGTDWSAVKSIDIADEEPEDLTGFSIR